MKKFPATLAAVVLGAAGFTAAALASGAHVLGVLDTTTTTTTATTTTATTTTDKTETSTTAEGGKQPKVALCHHTGSKKHPLQTITVAKPAVKAHLRHHDTLGACQPAAATTTATTTTTSTTSGGDTSKGHGNGKGHGKP